MSIKTLEGYFDAKGFKVVLVIARFNDFITNKLLEGALDTYRRQGGDEGDLTIVKVPGAFEIPLACQKLAATGNYDGIVALGAVIRGSTPHFDYVLGTDMTLYPNPTIKDVNLRFNAGNDSKVVIRVSNVLGDIIIFKKQEAVRGENHILLDVDDLENGIYLIYIQVGKEEYSLRFAKI